MTATPRAITETEQRPEPEGSIGPWMDSSMGAVAGWCAGISTFRIALFFAKRDGRETLRMGRCPSDSSSGISTFRIALFRVRDVGKCGGPGDLREWGLLLIARS